MASEELQFLETISSSLPTKDLIIEIGAWCGRSTSILYAIPAKVVVTVDTWLGEPKLYATLQNEIYYKDFFLQFLDNMKSLGYVPEWYERGKEGRYYIRLRSKVTVFLFSDESIDMLFIDGDHDNCDEDIELWLPKVKKNGLICGHDYVVDRGDVKKSVDKRFGIPNVFASIWYHYK